MLTVAHTLELIRGELAAPPRSRRATIAGREPASPSSRASLAPVSVASAGLAPTEPAEWRAPSRPLAVRRRRVRGRRERRDVPRQPRQRERRGRRGRAAAIVEHRAPSRRRRLETSPRRRRPAAASPSRAGRVAIAPRRSPRDGRHAGGRSSARAPAATPSRSHHASAARPRSRRAGSPCPSIPTAPSIRTGERRAVVIAATCSPSRRSHARGRRTRCARTRFRRRRASSPNAAARIHDAGDYMRRSPRSRKPTCSRRARACCSTSRRRTGSPATATTRRGCIAATSTRTRAADRRALAETAPRDRREVRPRRPARRHAAEARRASCRLPAATRSRPARSSTRRPRETATKRAGVGSPSAAASRSSAPRSSRSTRATRRTTVADSYKQGRQGPDVADAGRTRPAQRSDVRDRARHRRRPRRRAAARALRGRPSLRERAARRRRRRRARGRGQSVMAVLARVAVAARLLARLLLARASRLHRHAARPGARLRVLCAAAARASARRPTIARSCADARRCRDGTCAGRPRQGRRSRPTMRARRRAHPSRSTSRRRQRPRARRDQLREDGRTGRLACTVIAAPRTLRRNRTRTGFEGWHAVQCTTRRALVGVQSTTLQADGLMRGLLSVARSPATRAARNCTVSCSGNGESRRARLRGDVAPAHADAGTLAQGHVTIRSGGSHVEVMTWHVAQVSDRRRCGRSDAARQVPQWTARRHQLDLRVGASSGEPASPARRTC